MARIKKKKDAAASRKSSFPSQAARLSQTPPLGAHSPLACSHPILLTLPYVFPSQPRSLRAVTVGMSLSPLLDWGLPKSRVQGCLGPCGDHSPGPSVP